MSEDKRPQDDGVCETTLSPGDSVFWWRRIDHEIEFPYRAVVVAIGAKRITISVEDPSDASDRYIRHVTPERLQPVGRYYIKIIDIDQGPAIHEQAAFGGRYTVYFEVAEDLRPLREVKIFENGSMLSYDRVHWIDNFGMLGDGKINRNRKRGPWGHAEEIDALEFESAWKQARSAQMWEEQVATAQMHRRGAVPVWFTIEGWRPERTERQK